jgi:hypothetical protein
LFVFFAFIVVLMGSLLLAGSAGSIGVISHAPTRTIMKDPQKTRTTSLDRESCIHILDGLDETFNRRREARQNVDPTFAEQHYVEKKIFDLFEPEANCISDERFGGTKRRYEAFGDGPKFVCGVDYIIARTKSMDDCLVYNVGSNYEIDFEIAVKNTMPNCNIYTFDPTLDPDRPYNGGDYSEFRPWGFGLDGQNVSKHVVRLKKTITFETMSLETASKKLGHDGRIIDIIKIDCERCEYVAVLDALEAVARGQMAINQIQVEMHRADFKTIHSLFKAADRAGMRVFHKERNHWGCEGYRCVEYAFVHETFLRKANAYTICPGVDLENI